MTSDERTQYLKDHWSLYIAEEMAAAVAKAQERMKPHMHEMTQDIIREVMGAQIERILNEALH